VSDLNRDGTASNADLLPARRKRVWQIQVKGAANKSEEPWWVQYGFCTDEIIDGKAPMFNRAFSFYEADAVILVAVRSPKDYRCVVLPVEAAEEAAQKNLDREYRTLTRKGPGKNHIRYLSTLKIEIDADRPISLMKNARPSKMRSAR
jgi:hypothetical protein